MGEEWNRAYEDQCRDLDDSSSLYGWLSLAINFIWCVANVSHRRYGVMGMPSSQGRTQIFNANYGMHRGLAGACLVLSVAVLLERGLRFWGVALILVALSLLALTRMYRFGVHYATESIIQYLNLEHKS